MVQNGAIRKTNRDPFVKRGPRFGIEKPAIPGPGRPPLPNSVKERRALLRKKAEEISVKGLAFIDSVIDDPTVDTRDKIRAAEIALNHSLPKQEEVSIDDERPLRDVPTEQLEQRIIELQIRDSANAAGTGSTS